MPTKRTPVSKMDDSPAGSSTAVDVLTPATSIVRDMPVDVLDPHPQNPRKALGDLTELAQSITAHGIRQPLTAVPHPNVDGRYRIVIGHRRHAAATVAGLTTVPVLIDDTLSDVDQLELMLLENLQRTDLTVVEEGAGYQGLLDLGVKRTAIAKHTGRAISTVDKRVKVASLPPAFHPAIVAHQLTLEEAVDFADLRHTDVESFDAAVKKLEQGFASGAETLVRGALSKARQRVQAAKAVEHWKARGWELRLDRSTSELGENTPALLIRPWTDLRWTPKEHEESGCTAGVVYCSSSWMGNIESWGQFVCLDPDRHKERLAEVAELEAAKAAQRTFTPSPEDVERREREQAIAEDLAEAALARARFLCGIFQGTTEADKARQQLLIAHAIDVTHASADDPTLSDVGIDLDVLKAAVEIPFYGVDAVGRLALAVLTIPERLMPFNHWDYTGFVNGDCSPLAITHLRLLRDLEYPLSQWEARLLEEFDGVTAETAETVEADGEVSA